MKEKLNRVINVFLDKMFIKALKKRAQTSYNNVI